MSGKGLLLVAHGSRRESANREIEVLCLRLAERVGEQFSAVEYAFLELAQPDIPNGLQTLVARGADSVIVMPYFLAAGNHVGEDIPALLDQVRLECPHIEIRLLSHLGSAPELIELLAARVGG